MVSLLPRSESQGHLGKGALLALLSSALLFLASPGPFALPQLAWLALAPLFWALDSQTPRRAALLGLICGLAYYLPLLYWIVIVLATYGQVPLPIAVLALIFLALYMSCYLAAFAFFCAKTEARVPLLFFAPACWVALDLIRARLFTGFPWMDLAYTQYNLTPVIQVADLAGHYGLTFLLVLANVLLATLAKSFLRRKMSCHPAFIAVAAVLLVMASGYSFWRMQSLPTILAQAEQMEVAAIQGNIPQDQKWQPDFQRETIDTYLRLSQEVFSTRKPQLIVWPETALPFYPYEHPLFLRLHSELTRPYQTYLLTGAPHREKVSAAGPLTYANSAFLLSPDGRVAGRYDKQHLVPFGEYIPFRRILSFASPLVETLGAFSPGISNTPLSCQNSRIGVLICFEGIFPEISRQQAAAGANLLVTITNDAWFGRSSAPWQHLAMGVFRAVETRKTLVRAANTGISAFIDPMGRIEGASPLFSEYARSQPVALLSGQTSYVRWGYLFPWACLFLAIIGLWRSRKHG
ncbi:apolipoprotein N-acyltransferase [Thiovibrio frasassiensis]|uniref:Apolipoprotein N-acyltransferase n=1 Tax=Thiovibrio frasassiensis TaxID=2984131 RepID=A0A9X4MGU6_9BACT|nr:apolipoprotein N-acyltransferase [Thiovibrio frasassiensis]MDG4474574.1 apolipoprotein N-acyltransferase [Thiovibrio frasassiensis]